MCIHTKELTKKRNAVVCLRQGLSNVTEVGLFSPASQEIARHENYYDWLLDQWNDYCPVCEDIGYSKDQYPAALRKIENEWEECVCDDLKIWLKRIS